MTVIVPTAGRPERVAPCVESLAAMAYPGFEILIVDNSPSDGRTREQVQACIARGLPVRYAAERMPGSSVARNRGMRESSSDILAFTDDDVDRGCGLALVARQAVSRGARRRRGHRAGHAGAL